MKEPHEFVFEGFEAGGTTPVPDILFDELLAELSTTKLRILLYIIRRTYGFRKTTDAISFNQFMHGITTKDEKILDKGCGVKNRTVLSKALVEMEQENYITSTKGKDPVGDNTTTLYSLKFKEGSIKNVPPVVSNSYQGSDKNVLPVVSKTYPQETVVQQTDLQETVKQGGTKEETPQKPTYTPPSLTKEELSFWELWSNIDQYQKDKPKLKPSAIEHIKALTPHITKQEEMNSLVTFTRQKLKEQHKRDIDWIELGNIHTCFAAWDLQRNKPPELSEAEKIRMVYQRRAEETRRKNQEFMAYIQQGKKEAAAKKV